MNIDLSEGLPAEAKLPKGTKIHLLKSYSVDNKFRMGIYQGTLSEFDMLLRYQEFDGSNWSRLRTPKHIHWTVDILIKQNVNPELTKELIESLLKYWDSVKPLTTEEERVEFLSSSTLIDEVEEEAKKYSALESEGAYSVKFLILMARILMHQEKTNYHQAYMFRNLLLKLYEGKDLFSILSTATHS